MLKDYVEPLKLLDKYLMMRMSHDHQAYLYLLAPFRSCLSKRHFSPLIIFQSFLNFFFFYLSQFLTPLYPSSFLSHQNKFDLIYILLLSNHLAFRILYHTDMLCSHHVLLLQQSLLLTCPTLINHNTQSLTSNPFQLCKRSI